MEKEINNKAKKIERRMKDFEVLIKDDGIRLENAESRINDLETDVKIIKQDLGRLKEEGKVIKCFHCGYTWNTRSKALYLSCPNCNQKTPSSKKTKEKAEKRKINERKKQFPDYVEGHDPLTVMEEMEF